MPATGWYKVPRYRSIIDGVEVGVKKGAFAQHVLHKWQLREFYLMIDPWKLQKNYRDVSNVGAENNWSMKKGHDS